jgi:hypothetical protein
MPRGTHETQHLPGTLSQGHALTWLSPCCTYSAGRGAPVAASLAPPTCCPHADRLCGGEVPPHVGQRQRTKMASGRDDRPVVGKGGQDNHAANSTDSVKQALALALWRAPTLALTAERPARHCQPICMARALRRARNRLPGGVMSIEAGLARARAVRRALAAPHRRPPALSPTQH